MKIITKARILIVLRRTLTTARDIEDQMDCLPIRMDLLSRRSEEMHA